MSQKVSDGLGTKARDAEEIKYGRKLDRLNASDAGTKPSYLVFPLLLSYPERMREEEKRKHLETVSCPLIPLGSP